VNVRFAVAVILAGYRQFHQSMAVFDFQISRQALAAFSEMA
jgi:hypothetical protein